MAGLNLHSEAALYRRYVEFAKLMNTYLAHFPKAEKYGLAQAIRVAAYDVYALIVATVAPRHRGVNFVGYRTWASRRFVRRHALRTFRRAAAAGDRQRIASSLGHARRTASRAHMLRHLAALAAERTA